jgi:hypothetical protein
MAMRPAGKVAACHGARGRIGYNHHPMNWFRSSHKKAPERFYLLPGQGGEGYRRKRRFLLIWSVIVALLVSGVLAAAFYWMNRVRP